MSSPLDVEDESPFVGLLQVEVAAETGASPSAEQVSTIVADRAHHSGSAQRAIGSVADHAGREVSQLSPVGSGIRAPAPPEHGCHQPESKPHFHL
jgi:hypothetical protein